MDTSERRVLELLKQHGATLSRQRKHHVWKFPDGSIFVHASTMSDSACGWKNALSDLENKLGIKPARGMEGERREPRRKQARAKAFIAPLERVERRVSSDFAASLREFVAKRKLGSALQPEPKPEPFIPRHDSCYPMHKQVVMRTVVTVWLGRLLDRFGIMV